MSGIFLGYWGWRVDSGNCREYSRAIAVFAGIGFAIGLLEFDWVSE